MERETKRIRSEPEIRRQVRDMLELPGNAWKYVLEEMDMLEIFFADSMYPEFAQWMVRRNAWQNIWKYKVAPMLRSSNVQVTQVGLNERWNCLAWYFAIMGSSEEPLKGYWVHSIKRPDGRGATGEVRLGFSKLLDYTNALNGNEPQLIQLEINSTDGPRLRGHLLDFVSNKDYRTMRSQVVWRVQSMSDYFKSVAQVLYVLFQEGFFVILRFRDEAANYHIRLKVDMMDDAGPAVDDDDIIGIVTSDGRHFRVMRDIVQQMRTIDNLTEDAGTHDYIPLPNISSQQMELLLKAVERPPIIADWGDGNFFEMFRAAHYLDVQVVVEECITQLFERLMRAKNSSLWKEFDGYLVTAVYFYDNIPEIEKQYPKLRKQIWGILRNSDRALFAAVENNDRLAVRLLLKRWSFSSDQYSQCLSTAILRNDMDMIEMFLELVPDQVKFTLTHVLHAVIAGNLTMLQFLLDHKNTVLLPNESALVPTEINDEDLVLQLLKMQLKDGRFVITYTAFSDAWHARKYRVLQFILDQPAFQLSNPDLALRAVVRHDRVPAVRILLQDQRFDVNWIRDGDISSEEMRELVNEFRMKKRQRI